MPEVISHRGHHGPRIENTLPAIEAAMRLGVAGVEVDIQLAGDGSVAVLHDATTARLWDDPRPITAHSAATLAALGAGEDRIPTLEDVIDLAASYHCRLILDQKTPEAALAALALLTRAGKVGAVAFCGELPGLAEVRQHSAASQIYLNDDGLTTPDLRVLAAIRPAYINPELHGVSLGLVRAAHAFGVKVSCWTPSSAEDLAAMAALGVDAVMTDDVPLAVDLFAPK